MYRKIGYEYNGYGINILSATCLFYFETGIDIRKWAVTQRNPWTNYFLIVKMSIFPILREISCIYEETGHSASLETLESERTGNP